MRSTSPPRRRHTRAAPSGFMAYYTENFNKLYKEYSEEHGCTGNVTHISKIAAKKYAELSTIEKTKYASDVYFFKSDESPKSIIQKTKEVPKKVSKESPRELAKEPVPEPKQTVPEPKQTVPEPKQTVPEPKQTVPEPKQTVPEPNEEPLKEEIESFKFDDNTDDLNGFSFF